MFKKFQRRLESWIITCGLNSMCSAKSPVYCIYVVSALVNPTLIPIPYRIYQPKRAGNLLIPANPPVNKWDATLMTMVCSVQRLREFYVYLCKKSLRKLKWLSCLLMFTKWAASKKSPGHISPKVQKNGTRHGPPSLTVTADRKLPHS